jgi:phosphate transport system permease protein
MPNTGSQSRYDDLAHMWRWLHWLGARLSTRVKEGVVKTGLTGAATTSILIVALIFFFLGREAAPFVTDPGAAELVGAKWAPTSAQKEAYGIYPLLTGSLVVTLIATIVVIPFGVVGAVYISEVARHLEREFMKPFIELLAGIPSVVIGFFGLVVLGPLVKQVFGLESGLTAMTGGLLLALMAAPTVISISEDALRSVPASYKEASLALGASELQTIWRVTVPAALPGIVAAVMLGMGRVIGETMAVLMCTGNAALVTANPFESVRTMTATIAAEMGEVAFGSDHYRALFCVGVVLLLSTFVLNSIAQRVLARHQRE